SAAPGAVGSVGAPLPLFTGCASPLARGGSVFGSLVQLNTLVVDRQSAPRPSRAATQSVRPSAAANINAVSPLADSFAFGSAPASSSAVTAPAFPDAAASMSGVVPSVSGLFGSAPLFNNNSTTAAWPFFAPRCSGVEPVNAVAAVMLAPATISICAIGTSPSMAAT